ncbi:MAG: hypothetical protein NXY57DRAFT_741226 [Lentinula lateritia]|uniref:F-box domain-containing protein n=1 Tax=Lentinula lateritia TaxID=40482 RepID=A0ABQ8V4V9_9AGAR|nr:MAG: hypothetical protein NXY57DRAFT_741226 [Lentinula lateritia]KAJ4473247.1 hypothetical protein C8R41DRAFT_584108 [Lentinula lateritia]
MVATLPIEIVETILDQLANSKTDLHVCTLVCRAWAPRSRALLFNSLSTCPTSPAHISEPFLKTIQGVQSSHLKFLVKSVKVDCCHVSEFTRITFNTLRLQHLTRLRLCRTDFARFEWNICLTRTLVPSLDTLVLDRAVFKAPVQLLHFLSSPCFSKLRSLTMTDISYLLRSDSNSSDANWIIESWSRSSTVRSSTNSSSRMMLEEMEIGLIPHHNIFNILYHPNSPFNWACLRRITFYRIWDNGLIQGFLNGPLSALRCVEFKETEYMYHFASSGAFNGIIQNPAILSNLTELSVTFSFTYDDFQFLDDVVKEAQKGNQLRNISLVFPIDLKGLEIERAEPQARILDGRAVIFAFASLRLVDKVRLIVPIIADISRAIKHFICTHFDSGTNKPILVVYRQIF